jgi:hypothetical protein
MNDSLRNIYNKFINDSLNNKKRVMNDSLKKDIKNTPISK